MINANGAPVLTELTAGHLDQAVRLSSEMGWPYRLEDWAFAHRLGSGLALEESGRLIGTAMRWDYGDDCTSVGMIIVAKAFQKRGYGALLVDALLEDAKAKTVFLNATQEALALYRRRGFRCTGTINQHQGVAMLLGDIDRPHQITIADSADLTNVLALDQQVAGVRLAAGIKLSLLLGSITLIVLVPLDYLWWLWLGYFN
jgi:GNAT superfamily N-acetyltransferase